MSQTQTIPWSFISSTLYLTNFSSADTVIYRTDRVPDGFLGVIRDANVIFTTSGGGVYFQKRTRGGSAVRFTSNLTSDATGLSAIMMGGDRLEIAIGSTGVGVIDVVWHGELIPINPATALKLREAHQFELGDGV